MMRVQMSGSPNRFEVAGPDLIDLADELLDEMEPRAKAAAQDARDLWLEEMKRLLNLRAEGPPIEGQPPVRRKGELIRAFRKLATRVRGRVVSSGWSNSDPGASRVEYGFVDKTGRRTFPHPYIRTALENVRSAVEKRLAAL